MDTANMNTTAIIEKDCYCCKSYQAPLRERLRVKWQNWCVRRIGKAVNTLRKAFKQDPGFARVRQSNIAMLIFDEGQDIKTSNHLANMIMKRLFDVDIKK